MQKIRVRIRRLRLLALILVGLGVGTQSVKADICDYWSSNNMQVLKDIAYDSPDEKAHLLDLCLPPLKSAARPLPLVVCIHGGGWDAGDKTMFPAYLLPRNGYAVASINYRFSRQAKFPAQVEDCKKAIDWLIANSARYGLDSKRIGVWGGSAGGHLAALIGLGYFGGNKSQIETPVKAVCDWCGPTDLRSICRQCSGGPGETQIKTLVARLLGSDSKISRSRAKAASPCAHVHKNAPPFLIMHGDKDCTIPIAQSAMLDKKLKDKGVNSTFIVIRGGGHNFHSLDTENDVMRFFDQNLK